RGAAAAGGRRAAAARGTGTGGRDPARRPGTRRDTGPRRAADAVADPGLPDGRGARALRGGVPAGAGPAGTGDGRDGGAAARVRGALGADRAERSPAGVRGGARAAAGVGRRRGGDGAPLSPDRHGAAVPLLPGGAADRDRDPGVRGGLRDLARGAPAGAVRRGAGTPDGRLRPARGAAGAGRRAESAAAAGTG